MARWYGSQRKTRCDYCYQTPVVWYWYTGYLQYRGPYRPSGALPLNAAACAAHEGCVNWLGVVANHPKGRMERG